MELSWTGLADNDAKIYFDGNLIESDKTSPWTHNLNSKGGGSYSYQVCDANVVSCSAIEDAIF